MRQATPRPTLCVFPKLCTHVGASSRVFPCVFLMSCVCSWCTSDLYHEVWLVFYRPHSFRFGPYIFGAKRVVWGHCAEHLHLQGPAGGSRWPAGAGPVPRGWWSFPGGLGSAHSGIRNLSVDILNLAFCGLFAWQQWECGPREKSVARFPMYRECMLRIGPRVFSTWCWSPDPQTRL